MFGHVITFRGKLLAVITHVNVHQNAKTGDLVKVSEEECTSGHTRGAEARPSLQTGAIRGDPFEVQRLSNRYILPVKLNKTLPCFVHKERALAALYGRSFDTSPLVVGEILSKNKLSML